MERNLWLAENSQKMVDLGCPVGLTKTGNVGNLAETIISYLLTGIWSAPKSSKSKADCLDYSIKFFGDNRPTLGEYTADGWLAKADEKTRVEWLAFEGTETGESQEKAEKVLECNDNPWDTKNWKVYTKADYYRHLVETGRIAYSKGSSKKGSKVQIKIRKGY